MLGEMLFPTRFTSPLRLLAAELAAPLKQSLDYEAVERHVQSLAGDASSEVLESVLAEVFTDQALLASVRAYGGRLAYRFVDYRAVTVRLATGASCRVRSPYFVKASPKKRGRKKPCPNGRGCHLLLELSKKRGRKKPCPNGRGCHLLLELLGFTGRCSGRFVSEVVQMALLCPSLAVAHEVLSSRGLEVDVKTLRRLCGALGDVALEARADFALDADASVAGKRVVIGIDGGRLRHREPKRGRKKKGQKRQGYHTPWREPKLFTVYLLDEQGKVDKQFRPLHDATCADADGVFALLVSYPVSSTGQALQRLDIQQAKQVILTGDGADWIWNRIAFLRQACGLSEGQVVQVVDYFHAAQHLWDVLALRTGLREQERQQLYEQGKQLLWKGDIDALKALIEPLARGRVGKRIRKALDYFDRHAARMQYHAFKQAHIPQGSGAVESAIRRVINLRLKAPGTFWKPEMAEVFLFLRSQLIAGRWPTLMHNVAHRRRTAWRQWKDGQHSILAIPEPKETAPTLMERAA